MCMKETINPLIREQIEKCSVTDISHLDYNTYTLVIPKITKIKLEKNNVYIVKLDSSVLVPSMFNTNWNKGIPPISEYMQIDVTNMMTQFVRFNGIEYDPVAKKAGTRVWGGWVPIQCVTALEKL